MKYLSLRENHSKFVSEFHTRDRTGQPPRCGIYYALAQPLERSLMLGIAEKIRFKLNIHHKYSLPFV